MAVEHGEIPRRTLGATGEQVSGIGLGGWHIGAPRLAEQLSLRIIRTALDRGVNFLDNSWDYNDGESERRVGKALRDGYRDKAFVMTKVDGRNGKEALRQLDESLQRLGVACVDLVQHHEVIRFDDPHRIFREDGAHAALVEARKAGKLRYIGFTGHKDPVIHLHMIEVARRHGVIFDTVQMPLNVMDAHYRSFEKMVLPELVRANIGVLGMKSMGNGHLLRSGEVSPRECLRYALNLPTSTVIVGVDDMDMLDQACEAAADYRPMGEEEVRDILAKTESMAATGRYEPFKTTSTFDATAANPHWLGEDNPT